MTITTTSVASIQPGDSIMLAGIGPVRVVATTPVGGGNVEIAWGIGDLRRTMIRPASARIRRVY